MSMETCKNCGGRFTVDGAKYCPYCGMTLGYGAFDPADMVGELEELYGPPEVLEERRKAQNKANDVIMCLECGFIYEAELKYCPECGTAAGEGGDDDDTPPCAEKMQLLYGPPWVFGDND